MIKFLGVSAVSMVAGKVCVIGAGPSGLGILCWFAKQRREGKVRVNLSLDDSLLIALVGMKHGASNIIQFEENCYGTTGQRKHLHMTLIKSLFLSP